MTTVAGSIKKWTGLCCVTLGVLAMTACSGTVQDRLGMSRRAPDEFQVVRRQPLVVPPDYRLPAPGTPSPAQQRNVASRDAQAALFGQPTSPTTGDFLGARPSQPTGPSAAERALLAAVPGAAVPDIRERLLAENSELTQLDESRFLFILDWQRRRMTAASGVETPLDPEAEAARLEEEGRSARVVTRRLGTSVIQ